MAFAPVAVVFLVGLIIGAVILAATKDKPMEMSVNADGARFRFGENQKADTESTSKGHGGRRRTPAYHYQ